MSSIKTARGWMKLIPRICRACPEDMEKWRRELEEDKERREAISKAH